MISKKNRVFYFFIVLLFGTGSSFAQLSKIEDHYQRIEKKNKSEPQTIAFVQEEQELVRDYQKLKQIILMRHGEPALYKEGARRRKEAIQFVQAYDSVGIYAPKFRPVMIMENELEVIYTSSINRSISTTQQVFNREDLLESDPMFREFERKIFIFPNISLPLKWWLTGSRVLWFMGCNDKGIENFAAAKARAKVAAQFLENDAIENGKTLLVSHGLLNHFLVKYLVERGWKEVYDGGKGYLSQKVLVKYD